jgi:lysophospholipase L1-like esterase
MWSVLVFAAIQNPATAPVPRGDEWWRERHAVCVAKTKEGGFDVALIGDSITQGWESEGKAAWNATFAPLKAANFGFSGDRTEHLLWRLDNGEIVGADPKVVVLMIGTNNVGTGHTPEETAEGVLKVVDLLLAKTRAKVLLLGVFPRAIEPNNPMRVAVSQATRLFWNRIDNPRVTKLDIGKAFLRFDGTLRTLLMPDALHLNSNGYEIWARAIQPTLRRMLSP